jgi:lysophospholipase L1-like esterase
MTVRGRLLSGSVATVIALAGFVTLGAPTAAAGSAGALQYVALGDSYAAGIGAPPYVPSSDGCLQSNSGYPALLDLKKGIALRVNATCPGAKASDVATLLDSPQNPLNSEIRLVTLTVGGNDLGFAGLFKTCSTPGQEAQCLIEIKNAVTDQQLTDLYNDLRGLYGQVAADVAPDALIVVTGYPYLFEPDPSNPIITAFNEATAALNTTIENAVIATRKDTNANIVYVDVTKQFKNHGIGGPDEPFINSPSVGLPEAFHPNTAGYRAFAKAISAAIRHALDSEKQVA